MHRREVGLGIEIDQQYSLFPARQGSGKIEGGRRLADPAFLVENGDACHPASIYKQGFFT
jgi:hypothetical protein